MIELILPLLLNHAVPVMYQDELTRDGERVVVSLVTRRSLVLDSLPGMTGELPLSLYLLSLPLWPSLEGEWLHGGLEIRPPAILQAQQSYFARLLSGDTLAAWHEAEHREPDILTCQVSEYALWHQPFQRWLPKAPKITLSRCLQMQGLVSFLISEKETVASDENAEDDAPTSSVFSVLNLTIMSNSAAVPEWRPANDLRVVPDVEGIAAETFIFPLMHSVFVTSPYGMRYHPISHQFIRHEGVDLRAAVNSPVLSIADGQVVDTGYGPVTGFFVTVNHADGWSSRYLHLSAINVRRGESVMKGSVIAHSGNTGRSNGPHLHFEISQHQRLLDPMSILFTTIQSPNSRKGSSASPDVSEPMPQEPPIDMTPTIVLVGGEGKDIQIGVRIGKRTAFYAPDEPIDTDEGTWRIIKRYGKYKLIKRETAPDKQ